MSLPPPFAAYPESFLGHSEHRERRYQIRAECFACPGDVPGLAPERVLYALPAENLVVCSGTPPVVDDSERFVPRPVYALSETEPPAVPTGRVFVQAGEGFDLAERVATVGYAVESVPAYAPRSAWLVARDGEISSALAGLENLMALDGIESVEPQILRPSVRRA